MLISIWACPKSHSVTPLFLNSRILWSLSCLALSSLHLVIKKLNRQVIYLTKICNLILSRLVVTHRSLNLHSFQSPFFLPLWLDDLYCFVFEFRETFSSWLVCWTFLLNFFLVQLSDFSALWFLFGTFYCYFSIFNNTFISIPFFSLASLLTPWDLWDLNSLTRDWT